MLSSILAAGAAFVLGGGVGSGPLYHFAAACDATKYSTLMSHAPRMLPGILINTNTRTNSMLAVASQSMHMQQQLPRMIYKSRLCV